MRLQSRCTVNYLLQQRSFLHDLHGHQQLQKLYTKAIKTPTIKPCKKPKANPTKEPRKLGSKPTYKDPVMRTNSTPIPNELNKPTINVPRPQIKPKATPRLQTLNFVEQDLLASI